MTHFSLLFLAHFSSANCDVRPNLAAFSVWIFLAIGISPPPCLFLLRRQGMHSIGSATGVSGTPHGRVGSFVRSWCCYCFISAVWATMRRCALGMSTCVSNLGSCFRHMPWMVRVFANSGSASFFERGQRSSSIYFNLNLASGTFSAHAHGRLGGYGPFRSVLRSLHKECVEIAISISTLVCPRQPTPSTPLACFAAH